MYTEPESRSQRNYGTWRTKRVNSVRVTHLGSRDGVAAEGGLRCGAMSSRGQRPRASPRGASRSIKK